jgi:energy-coupling factor transporter ATP-binding protein EcfA2
MSKKSNKRSRNSIAGAVQVGETAYFLSLGVSNARCFGPEEQTLDLSDGHGRPCQWSIILGNNGTGKTTLLQLLAGMQPMVQGRFIGEASALRLHEWPASNPVYSFVRSTRMPPVYRTYSAIGPPLTSTRINSTNSEKESRPGRQSMGMASVAEWHNPD